MTEAAAAMQKRVGLAYWMYEVLDQRDQAAVNLGSDPVHDLRTALRRCRSLADGMVVFDPDPAWKKMKQAGKQLFGSLGELRDTHVMQDWIKQLAPEGDAGATVLLGYISSRECELRKSATVALENFDCKQWQAWAIALPNRAARIPADSPVFAHLALERWERARELHRRALRNRSKVSFHDLRIGIKRLRYTVESFLPVLNAAWGKDLKLLQDCLGDVHDLDVLWETALRIRAFPDDETRVRWRDRIAQERQQRVDIYRAKTVGNDSIWAKWRSELPGAEDLRALALKRLQIWASFHDQSVAHAKHVAELALQLYDGLALDGIPCGPKRESYRCILQAAALLHEVGRSRTKVGHHKASARLIRKLDVPLGWTAEEVRLTALVARYHRGALPRATQRAFAALPPTKQRMVQFLGGLLRLACACDRHHDGQIRRVQVENAGPLVKIEAEGYAEYTAMAEQLAAARHLLELACNRPVFILPLSVASTTAA